MEIIVISLISNSNLLLESDFMNSKKKYFYKIIFVLSIILINSSSSASFFLSEDYNFNIKLAMAQYPLVRDTVFEIWERYDPKNHIFVGIGKSPTPIIALMQAISSEVEALNLPLSNIRGFKPGGLNRYNYPQEYNPQLVARLYQHFDHFLPQQVNGKRIIVIDFADTGETLIRSVEEIRRYYAYNNPSQVKRIIGLGLVDSSRTEERLLSKRYHTLRLHANLGSAMIYHKYKRLAQYENFDLQYLDMSQPYIKTPIRSNRFNYSNFESYNDLVKNYRKRAKTDIYGLKLFANLINLDFELINPMRLSILGKCSLVLTNLLR